MKEKVDRLRPLQVPALDHHRRRVRDRAIRFAASRALAQRVDRECRTSAAASATLGVTTVARGSRRVFNIETASGASRVRRRRGRSHHHRIDDEIRERQRLNAFGTPPSTMSAVASMPVLTAAIVDILRDLLDLRIAPSARGSEECRLTPVGVLRGDGRDRRHAVHAERGKCLQIGLNAGAGDRIAAGDGERDSHEVRRPLPAEDQEILVCEETCAGRRASSRRPPPAK